jgi:3-carboxy-cis,cis-muconate cycloisomerase
MADLFWPGDERAGDLFSAEGFVRALTEVELAWLAALVSVGIAPPEAAIPAAEHPDLTGGSDLAALAEAAEAGGNPVMPLVTMLRERLADRNPLAAEYLHAGLTSQDVVDTALMRCSGAVLRRLQAEFTEQIGSLRTLSHTHRGTLMAGRTLSQFAVPITFGVKAAVWLQGLLDAAEPVRAVRRELRSQFGGAAGTMASTVDLADRAGLDDPVRRAEEAAAFASGRLELAPSTPWHTCRAPITRIGDALVGCTDAWGHLANDVITLGRPEIAEVAEPAGTGRGASSTMPQKRNPVLSLLIRRTALASPLLGAQLHLAAADAGDERPTGSWHTEWATLRTLARDTVVAAAHTTELLAGLEVDPARMRATLQGASPGILAERLKPGPVGLASRNDARNDALEDGTDHRLDPRGYLGTSERTIDITLARAERYLEGE